MGLYNKKLHIKNQNGIIQTANLYTDKTDVGSNYLTFKDGSNTVYSILDVNGDVNCKVNKRGNVFKINNANIINQIENSFGNINVCKQITIPSGISVVKANCIRSGISENTPFTFLYIKVTQNKTYNVCTNIHVEYNVDNDRDYEFVDVSFNGKTISDLNFIFDYPLLDFRINWSNEINKQTPQYSAD